MSTGRLVALGCVVALAVMVGIVGAVVVLGGMWSASTIAANRVTPTPAYTESTKPIPGRISAGGGGYTMTANENGGEGYFLPNGTAVQILRVSGALGQVQVMDGQHKNRVGWVPVNAVAT